MSISRFLPSKKFTIILSVCLVAGLGYFLVSKSGFSAKASNKKTTLVLTPEQIIDGDRDGDGVRDWEESLWGTNPDLKDSNDDGIDDLSDIESRRKKLSIENADNLNATDEELNETDIFSRDIFASIMSLKEKGALNEASIKSLAEITEKSFSNNTAIANIVELSDIKKTSTDTLEQRKVYLKKIDSLLTSYEERGLGKEFTVFAEYYENAETTSLATLMPISTTYENMSKELALIETPQPMLILHRDFINNTHKLSVAIKNISQIDTNGILGATGFSQYKEQSTEFTRIIRVYAELLAQHDIL
ncbi:MAG: hypothetical protein KBC42_02275 [Candidatus Pacebacteria bacterium]|nr:hypothetical protein [Candidatus Paceibacterota bacterium]MBP9780729.1 hypothetical protein [Candidatus Paceibacterota bacterium]